MSSKTSIFSKGIACQTEILYKLLYVCRYTCNAARCHLNGRRYYFLGKISENVVFGVGSLGICLLRGFAGYSASTYRAFLPADQFQPYRMVCPDRSSDHSDTLVPVAFPQLYQIRDDLLVCDFPAFMLRYDFGRNSPVLSSVCCQNRILSYSAPILDTAGCDEHISVSDRVGMLTDD